MDMDIGYVKKLRLSCKACALEMRHTPTDLSLDYAELYMNRLYHNLKLSVCINSVSKNNGPMHFGFAGVVLFPGATLPLRVIEDRLAVTIDKALRLVDAPCTIGVVRANHVKFSC